VIIYDLTCEKDHKFEGWFKDRASFEAQKKKKIIVCPICGSSDITMVPSSIAIMGKEPRSSKVNDSSRMSPEKAARLFFEYVDKSFEDVGNDFADIAMKIHAGEEDRRNIKGTTTKNEEETLRENGVPFIKLPIPKFDS
jgi:hypothetical protein